MKVLHTSPPMGPSYGGPFQSVRELAKAQSIAGMDVSVRMPWSADAVAHLKHWDPVDVMSAGKIWVSPIGWSPLYAERLINEEANILHTHGLWQHPSWAALAWKKKHGRPHIVSVRGMLEPWAWKHHAWKKRPIWWWWERRNLQSADMLHATSAQEADSLRNLGLTAPIAVIPNGVIFPKESTSAKLRTGRKQRTALFLSRIHPKKGLPLLLDAWAAIRPENWRLLIVGPDEAGHRAELKRRASLLGLSEVIEFADPVEGLAKDAIYREADLFILPTHSENFGIVVAEAMAHGLPVITTHGAPWRVLEEERCGWWVPVDVAGISQALREATSLSETELAQMGDRGRSVVHERFDWSHIAEQMIQTYEWMNTGGARPPFIV